MISPEIEALGWADLEEIRSLRARYCRFIDLKMWASLRGLFHDDAEFDGLASLPPGSSGSAAAFVAGVCAHLADAVSVHHCHTPEIVSVAPGVARGVWAMEDFVQWPRARTLYGTPDVSGFKGYGYYEEEYRRHDGRWLVYRLRLTRLRIDVLPADRPAPLSGALQASQDWLPRAAPMADRVGIRVGLLEDERAILQTLYAYGHAIDYGSEDEFMDCWVDGAVLDWPTRPAPFRGRDAIRGAFRGHTHAPGAAHKHFLVEPLIVLEGDRASVTSMFARLDRYAGIPHIRIFGRYVDRLVRCTDGRWRFTERKAECEAMRTDSPDVLA